MHGNTKHVVVTAIDADIHEGNFVEGEGKLQVGHILTKVNGDDIDSYEYDDLMDHIELLMPEKDHIDELMPVTSDPKDEQLVLTFKRDDNGDDLTGKDNELVHLSPRKRRKTQPRPYDNVLQAEFQAKSARKQRGKRRQSKILIGSNTEGTKQSKKPKQKFVMDYGVENSTSRHKVIVENSDVLDDPYMEYGTIVKGEELQELSLPLDGLAVVRITDFLLDRFPFIFVMEHLHAYDNPHSVNQSTDTWDIEFNGKNDIPNEETGRWVSKMDKNFRDPNLKSKVIDFFLFYFLRFNCFIDIHCFHYSNSSKILW